MKLFRLVCTGIALMPFCVTPFNLAHASPGGRAAAPALNAETAHTDAFLPPIPVTAPQESRIVVYTYSPDQIFRIHTRVGQATHIELPADEGVILKPQLGDTVQWRVSGGPRHLFIKPLHEGITTSLTLVTNLAQYQFQLVSGKLSGKTQDNAPFYQKVSFEYPDRDNAIKLRQEVPPTPVPELPTPPTPPIPPKAEPALSSPTVDPSSLDFAYRIVGDAPFRPKMVFSDGKFTWLKMPGGNLPIVLALDERGKGSWVNASVQGDYLLVDRVNTGLLLKLGEAEVRVLPNEKNGK